MATGSERLHTKPFRDCLSSIETKVDRLVNISTSLNQKYSPWHLSDERAAYDVFQTTRPIFVNLQRKLAELSDLLRRCTRYTYPSTVSALEPPLLLTPLERRTQPQPVPLNTPLYTDLANRLRTSVEAFHEAVKMSRDRRCNVSFLHTALTVTGVAHKIFEIEAQILERWLYASYFERCDCLDASTLTHILDRLPRIENTRVDYPLRDLQTDVRLLPHIHTILGDYLLVEPCTTYDLKILEKELRKRQTEILYYEDRLFNTSRPPIRSHLPRTDTLPAWEEPPWGSAFEA